MDIFELIKEFRKYVFRNKVHEVFTPSSSAKLNYVQRKEQEQELRNSILTPGLQIVLYGHSGSGKTTLIRNQLEKLKRPYITTSCEKDTTIEQLILSAFDKLNTFYISEGSSKTSAKISTEIKASYKAIESKIGSEISREDSQTYKRIVPIQLTPQRLSEFFGAAKCCWVLEDFHKVDENEKMRLSGIMKIFMDSSSDYPEAKIIAIGAVSSPREILKYNPELKERVAEIPIPLLDEKEMGQIISRGGELLNIKFPPKIIGRIISLSNGLGAVCHHLCLNICIQKGNKGINKTQFITKIFTHDDLNKSVQKYVKDKSDTFQSIYDLATSSKRTRKYENGKLIIEAMLRIDKDEVSHNEILLEIKKKEENYPQSNLSVYLSSLSEPKMGEIIRRNEDSGNYSFSNPFFKVFALMNLEDELRIDAREKINIKDVKVEILTNALIKTIKLIS